LSVAPAAAVAVAAAAAAAVHVKILNWPPPYFPPPPPILLLNVANESNRSVGSGSDDRDDDIHSVMAHGVRARMYSRYGAVGAVIR